MANNSNDPLRLEILKYLHELHLNHNGTHRYETQGDRLSYAVRDRTGETRESIGANLNYLVGNGFVNHRREPHYSPDGRQIEGKHLYSIAGTGIDRIEGGSAFMARETTSGVTVINRDGVVTVGSDNTVTVGRDDLPAILNQLAQIIRDNRDITDEARQDALYDLETVRAQASKSKPDIGIIGTAWEGLKIATTAKEAADLLQQAAAILGLL